MSKKALGAIAALILSSSAALAEDSYTVDTSDIGKSHNGVVSSDQFLELGMAGANALRVEGENSLRMGHLDRAIMVLQRAVEMAPLDMDGRILYSSALEKKLIGQKPRDPALFNYVVKQWLYIFKKAEFPDQKLTGRMHLMNMTGVSPGMMEREPRYLAKVLLPEDGSVKVALGKKRPAAAPAKKPVTEPSEKDFQ